MRALIFTTVILAVQMSMAGINDFNSLITDSNQARRDLQQELKKNVDALDKKDSSKDIVKEEKTIEFKEENIAVSTSSLDNQTDYTGKDSKKIDKAQLKRVSAEIESAKGF